MTRKEEEAFNRGRAYELRTVAMTWGDELPATFQESLKRRLAAVEKLVYAPPAGGVK